MYPYQWGSDGSRSRSQSGCLGRRFWVGSNEVTQRWWRKVKWGRSERGRYRRWSEGLRWERKCQFKNLSSVPPEIYCPNRSTFWLYAGDTSPESTDEQRSWVYPFLTSFFSNTTSFIVKPIRQIPPHMFRPHVSSPTSTFIFTSQESFLSRVVRVDLLMTGTLVTRSRLDEVRCVYRVQGGSRRRTGPRTGTRRDRIRRP